MIQRMNNPLAFMLQAMQSGGNPRQLVQQMASQDPRMRQITQLLSGKSFIEQRQYVSNFARERGLDLDTLARSLGISIPSER